MMTTSSTPAKNPSAPNSPSFAFSIDSAFTDHMVLQRRKPVQVIGRGALGTTVVGCFRGAETSTPVAEDGTWALAFPAGEAGGPFEMHIRNAPADTTVRFRDILVGDVWLCSGQSNMEFHVWIEGEREPDASPYNLPEGKKLVAANRDTGLRLLNVPRALSATAPCDALPGRVSWVVADSLDAVAPFSAVGYCFGLELRRRLGGNVPIGMINASWGGSRIEPWIPKSGYAAGGRENELSRIQEAIDFDVARLSEYRERLYQNYLENIAVANRWLREKYFPTDPEATAEALANWARPDYDDSAWFRGKRGTGGGLSRIGATWFRRPFTLPEDWVGEEVAVHMDTVNDCDETYLDGVKIGETSTDTPDYWAVPRDYTATIAPTPGGRHLLAVRHFNHFGTGTFQGRIVLRRHRDGAEIDLQHGDDWRERDEFVADTGKIGIRPPVPVLGTIDPRLDSNGPGSLYNAMIHPLRSLNVAGFLWYQGCSNAEEKDDYRILQKLLVASWRDVFRDPSLPFLLVQLSAFIEHRPNDRLSDDAWKNDLPGQRLGYAPFREMQKEFLDEPGCGVACTIDIGDHSDIHPANKGDVGKRLAHEAMRLAYGDASCLPGPRAASVRREGNALRVAFRDIGDGLAADGDAFGAHLFALADATGKTAWAEATLDADNTLVVSSPAIADPVRVEYAYSAFPPNANFRRLGDGLPVFPFRLEV
ncbi:MAG: sialate O-acetylesterase [Kiritimatiellia bacterium]|jgi:sialate O-acetylesterase